MMPLSAICVSNNETMVLLMMKSLMPCTSAWLRRSRTGFARQARIGAALALALASAGCSDDGDGSEVSAGSGALMLLVLSSIQSTALSLLYVLTFGVGSIKGCKGAETILRDVAEVDVEDGRRRCLFGYRGVFRG